MIFYGDRVRPMRTNDGLSATMEALDAAVRQAAPIERHAGLVEALIAAGEIAQGVSDAAFDATGHDDAPDAERAVMAVVHRLALLAGRSWDSGLERVPASLPAGLRGLVAAARDIGLPEQVAVRQPEGYAHYAVYPEAYWSAARAQGAAPAAQVIGIRSIGTSLSAMVAAAMGANVPLTVRPSGHPYARSIRAGPRLDAALRADPSAMRAIVDEGPGLSGSSFGAVADALEQRGVAADKQLFFPSHGNGPGMQASASDRARWKRARRHVVDFDRLVLRAATPAHRLEAWVFDITGAPLGPLQDLAGGRWRGARFGPEEPWPPCDAQNERRKFLLRAERGTFLLKFAGAGESGRRTFARAQALAGAGFSPPPLGLRHGFLVERWREDLATFDRTRVDRRAFLRHLGAYLAFRGRTLAAAPDAGALVDTLFEMMLENARERLGRAAEPLGRWRAHLSRLAPQVSRVQTDNRLHVWEWLTASDGGWIKTDAIDHCAGHDLIGCQDVAWDAAGATVEFDLVPAEQLELLAIMDRDTGRAVSRDLFRFCKAAYAAFQLGAFSMARDRNDGRDAVRADRAVDRYAAFLLRASRLAPDGELSG